MAPGKGKKHGLGIDSKQHQRHEMGVFVLAKDALRGERLGQCSDTRSRGSQMTVGARLHLDADLNILVEFH